MIKFSKHVPKEKNIYLINSKYFKENSEYYIQIFANIQLC